MKKRFNSKNSPKINQQSVINFQSILCEACEQGDIELVKILLYRTTSLSNVLAYNSHYALRRACMKGHFEIVKLVLVAYSDAERSKALSSVSHEPLRMACFNNYPEIVKLLLSTYSDVERPAALAASGHHPLRWSCSKGHYKIVKLLIGAYSQEALSQALEIFSHEALLEACTRYRHEIVPLLLVAYYQKAKNINLCANQGTFKQQLLTYFAEDPLKDRDKILKSTFFSTALDNAITLLNKTNPAQLFAQVLFLCDGHLGFFHSNKKDKQAEKFQQFFSIAMKLPLDVQMVLCNRVYGLANDVLLTKDIEDGLRKEAESFHP